MFYIDWVLLILKTNNRGAIASRLDSGRVRTILNFRNLCERSHFRPKLDPQRKTNLLRKHDLVTIHDT